MAALDTKGLLKVLKGEIITLAKTSFKEFAKEAEQDAKQTLEKIKEKFTRWVVLLAEGQLTKEDFELLVNAQKDLLEMKGLQKAGLAAIKVERFRDSVIKIVLDTAFKAIPGL
jgi:hypothetical protein